MSYLWKSIKLLRQYVCNYSYCGSEERRYFESPAMVGDTCVFIKNPDSLPSKNLTILAWDENNRWI